MKTYSAQYTNYLASPAWATRRERELRRANYRCEICGEYGIELHCHHLTYHNLGNEGTWDLMILCPYCHEKADLVRQEDLEYPGDRNDWIAQERADDPSIPWEMARWNWVIESATSHR